MGVKPFYQRVDSVWVQSNDHGRTTVNSLRPTTKPRDRIEIRKRKTSLRETSTTTE